MTDLPQYFAEVPDPRGVSNAQRHSFLEILLIALCALLSGGETFVDMEDFGVETHLWLRARLGLKLRGGIPSHDTFGRVFTLLCPDAFSHAMQQWTQALHQHTKGEVIALDGKAVRQSFDKATGKAALHVVNAWANSARLMLGQYAVEGKSNEIVALPTLLALLNVRGCIVTRDALNTQKGLAAQVLAQGGDYVMALKDNHGLLLGEVQDYFAWCQDQPGGLVKGCDSWSGNSNWAHGRHELRRCFVVAATPEDWPRAREQWPGLQSVVMIESRRRDSSKASIEQHFYLSSLPPDALTLEKAIRSHWGIENSGHWNLDVSFREDACRVRKDHGPSTWRFCAAWPLISCVRSLRAGTQSKPEDCAPSGITTTFYDSSAVTKPNTIALLHQEGRTDQPSPKGYHRGSSSPCARASGVWCERPCPSPRNFCPISTPCGSSSSPTTNEPPNAIKPTEPASPHFRPLSKRPRPGRMKTTRQSLTCITRSHYLFVHKPICQRICHL